MTKAIVGLGNPGPEYRDTRHNVGWRVVDLLAQRWRAPKPPRRQRGQKAEVVALERGGERVLLVKPLTYMNDSGVAVQALAEKDGLQPGDALIVYDDLDLPFGRVRVRRGGSAGGHRGVRSLIDRLGTSDFPRVRIGIGRPPPGMDPIDYVLTEFNPDERPAIQEAVERAADALEVILDEGLEAAMNRFNG